MQKMSILPYQKVMMEAIKDMVFIVSHSGDSTFKYEFFNQAVFEKTHMRQNDWGKTFQELHEPQLARLLEQQYSQAFQKREAVVFEDSFISPLGKPNYSKTTLTPLFDETGECIYVIGLVEDITNIRMARLENEEAWERLQESSSRYRSLYENNSDAIFSLDLEGRILDGNSAVEKVTGYPLNDLVGSKFNAYIDQEEDGLFDAHFQLAMAGDSKDFRTKFTGKSGKSIGILIHFAPIEVKNKVVGFYATMKDMRNSDKLFSQYAESERRFRIIAENAQDAIVLMDHDGETLYVSPSSIRITGFEPAEHMEKSPFHNVHPDDILQLRKSFSRAIVKAQSYKLEVRLKHKTNGWIWTEVQGTPIFDKDQNFVHMLTITRDITLQKENESQLHFYAYHDSLTGLPNRRFLTECLQEIINQGTESDDKVTVIILDIDYFKDINDKLGHEMGDAVIAEFGKRLQENITGQDVAARLGGDEFVLLLPRIKTEEQARNFARKIQAAIEMPWLIDAVSLAVTTSMGVALTSTAGATVSSILKKADIAMYESKKAGRSTYSFHCL